MEPHSQGVGQQNFGPDGIHIAIRPSSIRFEINAARINLVDQGFAVDSAGPSHAAILCPKPDVVKRSEFHHQLQTPKPRSLLKDPEAIL
jgi:hypothetical protein